MWLLGADRISGLLLGCEGEQIVQCEKQKAHTQKEKWRLVLRVSIIAQQLQSGNSHSLCSVMHCLQTDHALLLSIIRLLKHTEIHPANLWRKIILRAHFEGKIESTWFWMHGDLLRSNMQDFIPIHFITMCSDWVKPSESKHLHLYTFSTLYWVTLHIKS